MIRVRRMNSEDTAALHHIHTEAVQQVCAAMVDLNAVAAWLHGRTPEGYLRAADEDGETFLVAFKEPDQLVGFASWREEELVSLFVDPQFHGRGIGRKLFAACEKDAEKSGYAILRLNSTLNAQSYYEAIGFRPIRMGYHEKRGQRIPHVEMVRGTQPTVIE